MKFALKFLNSAATLQFDLLKKLLNDLIKLQFILLNSITKLQFILLWNCNKYKILIFHPCKSNLLYWENHTCFSYKLLKFLCRLVKFNVSTIIVCACVLSWIISLKSKSHFMASEISGHRIIRCFSLGPY